MSSPPSAQLFDQTMHYPDEGFSLQVLADSELDPYLQYTHEYFLQQLNDDELNRFDTFLVESAKEKSVDGSMNSGLAAQADIPLCVDQFEDQDTEHPLDNPFLNSTTAADGNQFEISINYPYSAAATTTTTTVPGLAPVCLDAYAAMRAGNNHAQAEPDRQSFSPTMMLNPISVVVSDSAAIDQTVPMTPPSNYLCHRAPTSSATNMSSSSIGLPRYVDQFSTVDTDCIQRVDVKRERTYSSASSTGGTNTPFQCGSVKVEVQSATSSTTCGVKRGRPQASSYESDGCNPSQDKKEKRRKQNRDAATRCRIKRRKEYDELKAKYEAVLAHNQKMKNDLEKANLAWQSLHYQLQTHLQRCNLVITSPVLKK